MLCTLELRYQPFISLLESTVEASSIELVYFLIQQYLAHFPNGEQLLASIETGLSANVKEEKKPARGEENREVINL